MTDKTTQKTEIKKYEDISTVEMTREDMELAGRAQEWPYERDAPGELIITNESKNLQEFNELRKQLREKMQDARFRRAYNIFIIGTDSNMI